MLAITVNTLVDENNGIGSGAGTSLREALFSAAVGEVIDFSVTGTINLTNLGQLLINKSLMIIGPGANLLTINGFDPTPDTKNGDGSRVFLIDDGNPNTKLDVEFVGITVAGGDVTGRGGGIFSAENLTVRESVISGNSASSGAASLRNGGGIYQQAGDLTIVDSTITGNFAGSQGGGIFIDAGNLTVMRSMIADNTVSPTNSVGGGGIRANSATITESTIRNNSAPDGGGLLTFGTINIQNSTISENKANDGAGLTQIQGSVTIESSTVSGNMATRNGGGIRSASGNLIVGHSTIAANVADSDDNNSGRGGGFFVTLGSVSLDHALVAGNLRRVNIREDVNGTVAARYSLIGDNTSAVIVSNGLNMIGNSAAPIVAHIGPLADNGGPTKSHALSPISPAIDLGDPYAQAGIDGVPLYDQRGDSFGRVSDGNGVHGARIDIGAYEAQSAIQLPELMGDYNLDGVVDSADYTVWRNTMGQMGVAPFSGADGNGDGSIGPSDYSVWKSNFGESLPSPGAASVAIEIATLPETSPFMVVQELAYHARDSLFAAERLPSLATPGVSDIPLGSDNALADRVDPHDINNSKDIGLLSWLASQARPQPAANTFGDELTSEASTPSPDSYDVSFALFGESALVLINEASFAH